MPRKCCVPGCDSERKDRTKLHMHKIPLNREKARIWLKVLSAAVPSPLHKSDALPWEDINRLNVCHMNFEGKYILPTMRLAPNACPTLFSSEEICSGTPTKTYDEIELMNQGRSTDNDHTYSRKRHYDHSYARDVGHMASKDIPEVVPSTSQPPAKKAAVGTPTSTEGTTPVASTSHHEPVVDADILMVAPAIDETAAQPAHYADGTPVSATLANTAELVSFLDDLFDSVNGASTDHRRTRGKKLRSAVTENSEHHAFWEKAIGTLENIKFLNKNGRTCSVPSLKNWVITLRSFQRLWQVMNEKNIKIFRPRYLNSDAIENFFGRVRSYNARNNDPTCHGFACTYKSLLITNLIKFHESSYNCEDDCSEQVLKIQSLILIKMKM